MAEELVKKDKGKFYRGIELEELKEMNIREFAKLAKARSRRSILRNSEEIEKFVSKCEKNTERKKPIKTHNRALVIVPKMVGKLIQIHNGKDFVKVEIQSEMLGHRLGEFSQTRKIAKHTSAGIGATKSTQALKK
ncbi:30S ribosomal protein S19 [Candidatus Pacearchaeota archaeon]|jgi:small subunit ribosomal protein S19|nr:30S ribosomal protein S19 [Candidatus Pacearchaeota archaeon]|tara:strand:+ start:24050 stop:24454 length:405 start_codon:yes stop_codon:yes gene_type:complete